MCLSYFKHAECAAATDYVALPNSVGDPRWATDVPGIKDVAVPPLDLALSLQPVPAVHAADVLDLSWVPTLTFAQSRCRTMILKTFLPSAKP